MTAAQSALSSVEVLVAALKADIVAGTLGPGQHINQGEWAARMNVSRTPVRLALERLEAEGFVQLVTFRGAVVTETTTPYLEDILAGRLILESTLARVGAGNLSAADLDVLRGIGAEIAQIVLPAGHRSLGDPAHRFHQRLFAAAGTPMVRRFATQAADHTHVFLNRYWYANRQLAQATKLYFAELLAACEAADLDRVERAMRDHRIDMAGVILADRVRSADLRVLPNLLSGPERERLVRLIDDKGEPTGPSRVVLRRQPRAEAPPTRG